MGKALKIHPQDERADAGTGQYLSFQMADETYAIRILAIREIIEYERLTRVPLMPEFIRGVINLRGAVVPILDLALRFGREATPTGRRTCIIIVEVEDEAEGGRLDIGILVDAVHEVLNVDPDTIEPPPPFGSRMRSDFISGMARMEDGFIILLDVDRVLSLEEMTLLASLDEAGERSGQPHEPE